MASRYNQVDIGRGGNIKFPNVGGNRQETKTPLASGYHGSKELEINRKRNDFIIKSMYSNQLPDIPCDPKHIVLPIDPNEFEPPVKELAAFYDKLDDRDAGVPMVLVGPTLYWKQSSGDSKLDPKDLFLLEDQLTKDEEDKAKRSKSHQKRVTWLRRPEEYITSTSQPIKGGLKQAVSKAECRVEEAIQRKLKTDSNWKGFNTLFDKEDRVKFIEKTFDDTLIPIERHPSKPGVFAEEIIPIYPDPNLMPESLAEVVFDTSPSSCVHLGKLSEDQMKKSLLKVLAGDDDSEVIGYFVPKLEDLHDHSVEYSLVRDYSYKLGPNKSLAALDDTYVFMEKEETMTYCKIRNKINLNRCTSTDKMSTRNFKLMVNFSQPLSAGSCLSSCEDDVADNVIDESCLDYQDDILK